MRAKSLPLVIPIDMVSFSTRTGRRNPETRKHTTFLIRQLSSPEHVNMSGREIPTPSTTIRPEGTRIHDRVERTLERIREITEKHEAMMEVHIGHLEVPVNPHMTHGEVDAYDARGKCAKEETEQDAQRHDHHVSILFH